MGACDHDLIHRTRKNVLKIIGCENLKFLLKEFQSVMIFKNW